MRLPIPRSPLTGALSAVAALSLGGAGLALHTSSGSAASATTRTVTVSKGVVQSTASGTGNLAAANQLTLNFGTSGTVSKVYVKEGEHVSQGQLIARVNSDSQKVALAEAKANLASAEDAVTTSTASAKSTDTGVTVDATMDDSTQVQMIDAAETTSTTPSTTPATTTPAAGTPSTTPQTGATGATGSSRSTTTTGGSTSGSGATSAGTSSGTGSAAGSSAAGSGGLSSGSSSGGSTSGGSASGSSSTTSAASAAAQVASDKLAVKEAQAALDDTELRAPVAGTIVSLSGAVGDSVSAGTTSSASTASSATSASTSSAAGGAAGGSTAGSTSTSSSGFATLSQLSKLSMSVSFSESDIGKVKVGQAATVTVSAADDVKLAARVTKIGLVATTSSSVVSYPVELTVTQHAAGVLAGMSATAEIVVQQATGVLNVPTQALSGKSVTVVKNGEKTTTPVTTGIVGTSTTQIVSGLSAGEVIALPTLSATSTTSSSSSTTSGRSAAAAGGFGGAPGGFGGLAGGAAGGFGGGTGGPPTR